MPRISIPPYLQIALRLTLASTIAMSIAAGLHLANPWWAAMAVWMVGQPPRGLLIERSAAQLVGAVIGASVGAGLGLLPSPALAIAGLSIWLALCCGLAGALRHQRSYGAALAGLTAAVVIVLSVGGDIQPVAFAGLRAMDTAIGIVSSLAVGLAFGRISAVDLLKDHARLVVSQSLNLVADALLDWEGETRSKEHEFLLSIASLFSSSEDVAAGSISGRRRLTSLHAVFASCLDLLVVARAMRLRADAIHDAGSSITPLHDALRSAAETVASGKIFDAQPFQILLADLKAESTQFAPLADEMDLLVRQLAGDLAKFENQMPGPADRLLAHPEWSTSQWAALRGAIAVASTGGLWLVTGVGPLRYVCLAASIFTVLFSAADEPAALVRQVFIGAAAASIAAIVWHLAVSPAVDNIWIGVALTVPLVLAASVAQARQGTMFLGLAFNMLFAVQARAADLAVHATNALLTTALGLLVGVALSYALFRWLVPMSPSHRSNRLRDSIRKEIAGISRRAGTKWAGRHMGRLRFLVLGVAVRSRGNVDAFENALSVMTMGHIARRLGDFSLASDIRPEHRQIAKEGSQLIERPPGDVEILSADFRRLARSASDVGAERSDLVWLLQQAAAIIDSHGDYLIRT
jgi:uncharacterized membrane protein YccC